MLRVSDDFEVNVSPTEHNINIDCNTGFYYLVGVPAFSNISTTLSINIDGMIVSCYDITGKQDMANANVNNVYFFRLSSANKNSIAKVVVHLHHTAR